MRSLASMVFGRTERALAAAILITVVTLSLSSPYFLTVPNLVNLVEAYSVTAILAAGVLVVLVCGGIDISFTATAAAAQYFAATLATKYGMPLVPTLLLSACLGIGMGALNALLIHYLRVGSIIVTIATSSIYYALLIYFTDAHEIYDLPDWWAEPVVLFRTVMPSGDVVKIGLPILVMCLVLLFTHMLMNHTRLGRQIYAFGGNPEAASRIGINILGVQLFAYGYLGLLAAIGGFIQAYRVHQAVPTAMAGQELNVLAVAILGGASLVGGIGSVGGVVLGLLFLAILQNGLNLLGVSSYFFGVVTGLAILVSILMTGYAEKRSRRPQWRGRVDGTFDSRPQAATPRRRRRSADRLDAPRHGRSRRFACPACAAGGLFLAGRADDISARDDAAGADVPGTGAGPAVAGDGDPADLRRHQSRHHRHRQPVGIADGLDPDRGDASRGGRGGARLVAAPRPRCGLGTVRDRRLGHRPAGRRCRRPSDPGDPRHHDAASRDQHLFHPRAYFVGISRTADRGCQRNHIRHPDLVRAFHSWSPLPCTCS